MSTVVVIGLGELGGVFAHGLLRLGHTVVPLLRSMDPDAVAERHPDPELVLVAVGEADLAQVLTDLPARWRSRTALLQNELLPHDYASLEDPTVAVVWFEKKPKRPLNELLPTQLFGPKAPLLRDALATLKLESELASDPLLALVEKNLYILTVNLAGLQTRGTVRELWRDHRELAERVADEVLALQSALCGSELPRERLLERLVKAIDADPEHVATGRSAPARLERALTHAHRLGVAVPELERIARAQHD